MASATLPAISPIENAIAEQIVDQRHNPMTKAELRKEACLIALDLADLSATADCVLADPTLSGVDIRSVRDMEREARKHLKRLQTLKAEMLFHRKIRKLQAGALLLKRRERCEVVN